MKMNHLTKEKVDVIMAKVKEMLSRDDYPSEQMIELFRLSEVDDAKFLECKNHPLQKDKVDCELDPEMGIRFFDPFNFFTRGIYKDMDGWSRWTAENLKEPWT